MNKKEEYLKAKKIVEDYESNIEEGGTAYILSKNSSNADIIVILDNEEKAKRIMKRNEFEYMKNM